MDSENAEWQEAHEKSNMSHISAGSLQVIQESNLTSNLIERSAGEYKAKKLEYQKRKQEEEEAEIA